MFELASIPLSLYVHFPWCVQKCPYCDFNSHTLKTPIPEEEYIATLLADLDQDLELISGRSINTIFFGGGTPSLMSGAGMALFLSELRQKVSLIPDAEITLESNPGTVDSSHFAQYRKAGVNRLSIGVQSFRDHQLAKLGRIHSAEEAVLAFQVAREAGFDNINLDLMFGLPDDDSEGSLSDLERAVALEPEHLSWYQLTMEPNTLFYKQPPILPNDDQIWAFQEAGQSLLTKAGYQQYEISAYAQAGQQCQHNLNYWKFGDYLGIGAGAHGKVSRIEQSKLIVERITKPRHPKQYLDLANQKRQGRVLEQDDITLEFMMNALRLKQGFLKQDFEVTTGMPFTVLEPMLAEAQEKGLLVVTGNEIAPSEKGLMFLNDLLAIFS